MLRLPYLRITPAIAAVSPCTICSVLSILSAIAITSLAPFHPHEQRLHSTPSTQNILHACCIIYVPTFLIPPTKVLQKMHMRKQRE